jgi:hypothetical protein
VFEGLVRCPASAGQHAPCAAAAAAAAACRRIDATAFRSELKEVLRAAGVEGTPLLLFLEERHLADDPGAHGRVLWLLSCPYCYSNPAVPVL